MKKTTSFLSLIALSGALLMTACNNSTTEKVEDKMDTMANNVSDKIDNMQKNDSADDADFVREVVKTNAKELHMLALGKTKGTDATLKSDAKKMEADHKNMDKTMKDYAASKNITLDSADVDHDMDDDAKGADWDKHWADHMVDAHEKVIDKFKDEQDEVMDPALKDIITNTIPVLQSHLDMAKALKDKLNK